LAILLVAERDLKCGDAFSLVLHCSPSSRRNAGTTSSSRAGSRMIGPLWSHRNE
jgi:hypothetical protein